MFVGRARSLAQLHLICVWHCLQIMRNATHIGSGLLFDDVDDLPLPYLSGFAPREDHMVPCLSGSLSLALHFIGFQWFRECWAFQRNIQVACKKTFGPGSAKLLNCVQLVGDKQPTTPRVIWLLLAVLVGIGTVMSRSQHKSWPRITLLPTLMVFLWPRFIIAFRESGTCESRSST